MSRLSRVTTELATAAICESVSYASNFVAIDLCSVIVFVIIVLNLVQHHYKSHWYMTLY